MVLQCSPQIVRREGKVGEWVRNREGVGADACKTVRGLREGDSTSPSEILDD